MPNDQLPAYHRPTPSHGGSGRLKQGSRLKDENESQSSLLFSSHCHPSSLLLLVALPRNRTTPYNQDHEDALADEAASKHSTGAWCNSGFGRDGCRVGRPLTGSNPSRVARASRQRARFGAAGWGRSHRLRVHSVGCIGAASPEAGLGGQVQQLGSRFPGEHATDSGLDRGSVADIGLASQHQSNGGPAGSELANA